MCILTKHVCYSFGSSSQSFIFALLLSSWHNKSASTNPSSCYHGWAYAIAIQILRIMGCVVSYPGHRVLCKPAPSHTAYGLARLGHWRARDDRWQPHRLFRSSRTTCFLYPQKEFDIGAAPDRNVSLDVEDYLSMSAEKEVEAGASTTLRPHITARSM